MGYGFKEVLIDQPFSGKWMEVDMNLGGGHSTFQGTKFSDFAGGFSYRMMGDSKKGQIQNRCIYWRTLNDTLELTEISMDHNLIDNQVRYIFQGSPIVGPITIQETELNLVVLVATVTSVNRFVFTHPKRVTDFVSLEKNSRPSIFHQICNKPQMNFRSFNLYEHAVNIPVPLSACCHYIERGQLYNAQLQQVSSATAGDCMFAFSYESGGLHLYKIGRDDSLSFYDLRHANMFARIYSGIKSSFLKTQKTSSEAAIGLSFFTKNGRGKSIQIVTLSMNGHLTLWNCANVDNFNEWSSYHCGVVDECFAVNNFTDSSMLLRKSDSSEHELPVYVIYIPGIGFRVYKVCKILSSSVGGNEKQLGLQQTSRIDYTNQELVDFSVTPEYLLTLVNNPEEETEWDIQSFRFDTSGTIHSIFHGAILEPLPKPDVLPTPSYQNAKGFYMDLIFRECSFSSQTITKALMMFRKEGDEGIKDKDWDSLQMTAMGIINREIDSETSNTEFDIPEVDLEEICQKYWLMFYNSCVEYHIHTVKPLGLFYESNTRMVCLIKKSRISFLRPTDFLETMFYFPSCLGLAISPMETVELEDDDTRTEINSVVKYLEIVRYLESVLNEEHLSKIHRRLRDDVNSVQDACKDIAHFIVATDPFSFHVNYRQLVQVLGQKLRELGENVELAINRTLCFISSWDFDNPFHNYVEEEEFSLSDTFMGSRLGAHVTIKILKQLLQHRFMLARDTMILQHLFTSFFPQTRHSSQIGRRARAHSSIAWEVDQQNAKSATLAYFALLQLAQEDMAQVPPFVQERGVKVSNILNLPTTSPVDVDSTWPPKVFESYTLSKLGSTAIKSNFSRAKMFPVLAHVEATGRCIWNNGAEFRIPMSMSMPANGNWISRSFEDFLILSCQYAVLKKYANRMVEYFGLPRSMQKFYLGLASVCLFQPEVGVRHWRRINFKEAIREEHFCSKVLQLPAVEEEETSATSTPISLFNLFYVRVIKIVQALDNIDGVQGLAEDALQAANTYEEAIQMCSLAFKCALELDNYGLAYSYILKMPCRTEGDGDAKEKSACLRMFVGKILKEGELEVLLSLDLGQSFNKHSSIREQVEEILFAQANLSDPLQEDGVYQILCAYQLCKGNFHKAASTMYYRAMRIGDKGLGAEGLQVQKECYLDVVTALALVEPEQYRFVIKKTGILGGVSAATAATHPPEVYCYNFEDPVDEEEHLIPNWSAERSLVVLGISEIQRELELICMLVELGDESPVNPLDFERRAGKAVEALAMSHYYDDAIKLASMWKIDPTTVISYFTDVCCNLVNNILPESGDPNQYLIHNDTSELPSTETAYADIAFRLLQSYLEKLEAPGDSSLHQTVTMKLLSADMELPQWLVASYKKRNTAQYLRCLIEYGEWEKGVELAVKVFDATLGTIKSEEFDFTIKKISAVESDLPVVPQKDINRLCAELEARAQDSKEMKEMLKRLEDRIELYCDRVNQCCEERRALYGDNFDRKK